MHESRVVAPELAFAVGKELGESENNTVAHARRRTMQLSPQIVPERNETGDADELQDEYWQYEVVDNLGSSRRWRWQAWRASILTSRHAEYLCCCFYCLQTLQTLTSLGARDGGTDIACIIFAFPPHASLCERFQ